MLRRTFSNVARSMQIARQSSNVPAANRPKGLSFPVYLINLDRAAQRRRFALGQLESIGVRPALIHGVDGSSLELPRLIEQGVYDPKESDNAFSRQLSMAEIGCSLSHYEIYQAILDRDDEVALVLEDDTLFLSDFPERLMTAYLELPTGWGVLHLNCSCQRFEKLSEHIVKYDGMGSLPTAASAYLISRRGAQLLRDQAIPIRYPADSLIGRGLRWGVETYGTTEALTGINNLFPTQIQQTRGLVGAVKSWIKSSLSRLLYPGA